MTQTATYIHNEEAFLTSVQLETAVDNVNVNTDSNFAISNKLFGNVIPFFYNNRVRLNLFVSEELKTKFAFIKGLIEFYRLKNFSFRYNTEHKSLETDVPVAQVKHLESFFDLVLQRIEEEIKFKEALKNVIRFENEYKKLAVGVYTDLMKDGSRHQ